MTARICSEAQSTSNAEKVKRERPRRSYAPVFVTIVSSNEDKQTVTFTAIDRNKVKRTFSDVPWNNDDMFTECPTTLPFEPGQLPAQNAEGTLHLSAELLDKLNILGTPKFPQSLPEGDQPLLAPLRIAATSIIVTGAELDDGDLTVGTIDLLDLDLAARDQTLVLNGNSVTLMLTPEGFNAWGHLTFPVTVGHLEVAVRTITAKQNNPREMLTAWRVVNRWVTRLAQHGHQPDSNRATKLLSEVIGPVG